MFPCCCFLNSLLDFNETLWKPSIPKGDRHVIGMFLSDHLTQSYGPWIVFLHYFLATATYIITLLQLHNFFFFHQVDNHKVTYWKMYNWLFPIFYTFKFSLYPLVKQAWIGWVYTVSDRVLLRLNTAKQWKK